MEEYKEKVIKLYDKYGIDYTNNKIVFEYISFMSHPNEFIRKVYRFIQNEFLLDLHELQTNDKKSFLNYVKRLNDTQGKINFWGERFELFFHSKLLKGIPHFFDSLKRGKDGSEPDFLLSKNNIELGIELTTLHIQSDNFRPVDKLVARILEKNKKQYANEKCLLAINVTNLNTKGKLLDYNLVDEINSNLSKFSSLRDDKLNFGCVFLLYNYYGISDDLNLHHFFEPQLCLINDNKVINNDLKVLINILFPNKNLDMPNMTHNFFIPFI